MAETKPPTHDAYALHRYAPRAPARLIEIGKARIDSDPDGGHRIFLDRLPIGGFNGYIQLLPIGVKPKDPEPKPERPAQPSEEEDPFA